MKIKRFAAANMRAAMQQVREAQGPDAVILSTRQLPDGVEIVTAVDYDEALAHQAALNAAPAAARASVADAGAAATAGAYPPAPPATMPATMPSPLLRAMREDIDSLREMLELQLASLTWNDTDRRRPNYASALRQLTRMDIEADVARAVADELPPESGGEQARCLPLGLISRRIVAGKRQLSGLEGVMALVGPTGVGKTTTVAKLAAHAVLHHGADQVALISTDHYRIGAGTQLGHYGRLLGVPVHEAQTADELAALLARLRNRRTILIDSAGMGAHDPQLADQLQMLRAAQPRMAAILVLAANAHVQAMDDAVRAHLPLQPDACILTKLDEAPRVGGALSVLIRYRLPLDFTTAGQRVPQDITAADVPKLVCRAAIQNRARPLDDVMLAERFSHRAPAAA